MANICQDEAFGPARGDIGHQLLHRDKQDDTRIGRRGFRQEFIQNYFLEGVDIDEEACDCAFSGAQTWGLLAGDLVGGGIIVWLVPPQRPISMGAIGWQLEKVVEWM